MSTNFFNHLVGPWQIKRSIQHHDCAESIVVEGMSEFIAVAPNLIHYHEQTQLHLPEEKIIEGEQEYFYRLENDSIQVYFSENHAPGALFHTLDFKGDSAQAAHLCKADHYEILYHVFNKNHFAITYRVTGPKKNYVSRSELRVM